MFPADSTESETQRGAGPLTDTDELARALASAHPPVVLDVRWRLNGPPGLDSYLAGHVPGAVFIDLDRDLASPPGAGGRHPLPDTAEFQAAMRRAGVSVGRPVVAYDDADSMSAARAWWLLRYFGHQDVSVLDGGYRAWAAAGGDIATGDGAPATPGDFTAAPGHMPLIDAEGASRLAREGVLLDARAAERYTGTRETIDPIAGHIPGAVNAPTMDNVGPDGRFRDAGALRARFAGLGATADGPLPGAYCGSGVTAAHEVLAMSAAGIPAALYLGSWSHWITDPGRPVATGAAPG